MMRVATDASCAGFGGYRSDTGDWFFLPSRSYHRAPSCWSAWCELYAIAIGAATFAPAWPKNCALEICCDNTGAVGFVRMRESAYGHYRDLLGLIKTIEDRHGVKITATYTPGFCNDVADALSRGNIDRARCLCPTLRPDPLPTPEIITEFENQLQMAAWRQRPQLCLVRTSMSSAGNG